MDTMLFDDAVLRRAQDAVESARANLKPIALDCAKAAACALLMAGAAYAEVVSATIAIDAAYPKLSDGTSTADAIMGMRYTVAFYALLGHVLISSITGRFAIGIKWLLAGLGLASILTMLLGMGLFSFAGTALTVGGDSEPSGLFGLLSGMAGPALGAVCGSLFVTGFIAAHFIAGRLLVKLGVISSAHAERAKVASLDGEINAADGAGGSGHCITNCVVTIFCFVKHRPAAVRRPDRGADFGLHICRRRAAGLFCIEPAKRSANRTTFANLAQD